MLRRAITGDLPQPRQEPPAVRLYRARVPATYTCSTGMPDRSCPPWFPRPRHGSRFRALRTLHRWVAGGCALQTTEDEAWHGTSARGFAVQPRFYSL